MARSLGVAFDDFERLRVGLTPQAPGTALQMLGRFPITITPVAVPAATAAEQVFSVAGVNVGDAVSITPPGITAGAAPVCARVSAAGVIAITFMNATAAAVTPLAGVYQISVMR